MICKHIYFKSFPSVSILLMGHRFIHLSLSNNLNKVLLSCRRLSVLTAMKTCLMSRISGLHRLVAYKNIWKWSMQKILYVSGSNQ